MAIITAQNRVIDWTNPNSLGGGLPGFIEVPVYIRQEPGKSEQACSLDLWFSAYPIKTWDGQGHGIQISPTPIGGIWSLQHLYSGFEFIEPRSMWVNKDVPIDRYGVEVVQGSPRIGCMYMTEQNPNGGRFERGFGWIHCMVQKFGMSLKDMNVPCDGLACTIQVRTGNLMPGLYGYNTGFALDAHRKTGLWTLDQYGPVEITCIHKPSYLYIRHSEWKPYLGRIKSVDPAFPIEELELTVEDLMAQ